VLNFLQHMSGVACRRTGFVRRVAGRRRRFTIREDKPGFRALDIRRPLRRGFNHRVGLYDASWRRTPLAGIATRDLREWAGASSHRAARRSRKTDRDRGDSLEQFQELLKVEGVHVSCRQHGLPDDGAAVQMRDAAASATD